MAARSALSRSSCPRCTKSHASSMATCSSRLRRVVPVTLAGRARGADVGHATISTGRSFIRSWMSCAPRRTQPLDPRRANRRSDRSDQEAVSREEGLPMTGVDGAAISRASIGPAACASEPALTAAENASAIPTGTRALAMAVLISTASKPIFHGLAAWRGHTDARRRRRAQCRGSARVSAFSPNRLLRPRPDPIGAPHGISIWQPASTSCPPRRDPPSYRETPQKPSAVRMRAASTRPKTSG